MFRFLFGMMALALMVALVPVSGETATGDGCPFTCGLNATYILLNKTGHHTAYSDLMSDFEKQNPPDSLLAIRNVLEKHGCLTEGVKTDAGYFLSGKGPAIVLLQLTTASAINENHFSYLVQASRQNGVELLDPIFNIRTPSMISWDSFSRCYQGMALILK